MTTSLWDETVARHTAADEQDDETVRDPDYERPTYDEWRRDEEDRQFAADMRHAGELDHARHSYRY